VLDTQAACIGIGSWISVVDAVPLEPLLPWRRAAILLQGTFEKIHFQRLLRQHALQITDVGNSIA
jgi:hypothetical protein